MINKLMQKKVSTVLLAIWGGFWKVIMAFLILGAFCIGLLLLLFGYWAYRTWPTQFEHEGYSFQLPMTVREAREKFNVSPLDGMRMTTYDADSCKQIQISYFNSFSNFEENNVWGINFYYDMSQITLDSLRSSLEETHKNKFEFKPFFNNSSEGYYQMPLDRKRSLLLYSTYTYEHSTLNTWMHGPPEKWVVTFCENMFHNEYQILGYVQRDGSFEAWF